MELPKYHETFLPILEVLSKVESLHHRELWLRVREYYYKDLPSNLLEQKTSSGANILLDRIGWWKSYLKMGNFVDYPKRWLVQITEKWRKALKEHKLNLEVLHNDSDFIMYRDSQKAKKNEIEEVSISNASPQDLIDAGFLAIETQVKADLLERIKNIDPYYFEKLILILLKKMGYGDFIETPKSRDGGIDGIINEDKLGLDKIYIQAKRYTENKVHAKEITYFIWAMSRDTTKGIFVTTSSFDDGAIKKAHDAQHKIILIDGSKLVDLMHLYGVGVQVRNMYEVKEIDEDFFDAN